MPLKDLLASVEGGGGDEGGTTSFARLFS